ncbi:DUF4280 domain-containing protein [Paenibacillus septentrionalis]
MLDVYLTKRVIRIANVVCGGAVLQCSFGTGPSIFNVLPANKVTTSLPIANIMDNKAIVNISPFILCQSLANPTVASATAAAFGALTPMPCMPVPASPWTPGSPTVQINNFPAVTNSCKCMCSYGGVISVQAPGQVTIQAP